MAWGLFDFGDPTPAKSDVSEEDYPECDYDTSLTPLYEAIEERAWIAVNQFLHSGYWPESLFTDPMSPELQARTWVTRYETRPDGSKKVRWSQLPIHAAVIFGAPSVVIQQLVEAFPQSVRCTDDHRMLPLHLAFRHGSDDSVLALFLEEFPEAVNVRGYKGRLPVECAHKGPNPERGAIIQTILHKNQSAWERKKSAVQLKELYCIKEALKIKSQKVSHLETAIREIKSREHKTRKELGATMTELKAAKIKTKDDEHSASDQSAERHAVKQLVEKLAALEMATKDLVDKEKSTKRELQKTLAELEATKMMKPTDDQKEQFAKLEKVGSVEEPNQLERKEEEKCLKRTGSKVSFDGELKGASNGTSKKEGSKSPKSIEAPLGILKKVEETKNEATAKKEEKAVAKSEETSVVSKSTKTSEKEEQPTLKTAESSAPSTPKSTTVSGTAKQPTNKKAEAPESTKDPKKTEDPESKKAEEKAKGSSWWIKKKADEASSKSGSSKHEESNKSVSSKRSKQSWFQAKKDKESAVNKTKEEAAMPPSKNPEDSSTKEPLTVQVWKIQSNTELPTTEEAGQSSNKAAAAPAISKDEAPVESTKEPRRGSSWWPKNKKKAESSNKSVSSKSSAKSGSNKSVSSKSSAKFQKQPAAESSVPAESALPPLPMSASRELEKLKLQKLEETNNGLEKKKIAEIETPTKQPKPLERSASRENEKQQLQRLAKANDELEKKIAELATAASQPKPIERSASSETNDKLEKKIVALETAVNQRPKSIERSASRELEEQNVQKVTAENAVANQKPIEGTASREMEKQQLQKVAEANDELEKKIAALDAAVKVYELKTSKVQEDLDAVSVPDKFNNFTEQQTEQMTSLQGEMKALKENSDKTKEELDAALHKLEEIRSEQKERESQALREKAEMDKVALETNKKLEKKVALLELALKQFEDKSSLAKTEMHNIKDTVMKDTDVKLTEAQQRYMGRLEESMEKLEKNASKTKKELDNALAELDAMKAKELENAQLLAAVEQEKFRSVEQTNKALEEKIKILEFTMKSFEEKATKTKHEMEQAMEDLKRPELADDVSAVSGESICLTKKQKGHMKALEDAMAHLEDRATSTKQELDKATEELADLKKSEEVAYTRNETLAKKESKAMRDLAKKVQALQAAMVGFEVKETRTMQEIEKTMQELEDVSNKRFEVLSRAAQQSEKLATDAALAKEVTRLDKRASKEEKRMVELEKAIHDISTKGGDTRDELDRTTQLLSEILAKDDSREPPMTKEDKESVKQDKKLIKDLNKKVSTLQTAVVGFEVKETKTMKELEHTMKQLEQLTSKRFEVLEQAAALKEKDTERLAAAGALAEEKVAALHIAMKELEANASKAHEELERTKIELENMRTDNESGASKEVIAAQEGQIQDLNEKISLLQQAVVGFEAKESRTMQELDQTMKKLEELTSKRFEVLQKVAGREIEAAKAAEAEKFNQIAAREQKKVAAIEFAMRELESKAYKTKLELERTMKGLEHLEEKQEVSQKEASGVTMEEKRVMRELVSKVADIQEAVMAYDEKEHKTTQELETTKLELEATKREVEELRAKQEEAKKQKHIEEIQIIADDDAKSEVKAVEVNDSASAATEEEKEASETAKRVAEETLTSLETAIHRLVERLGTEEEDGTSALVAKIAAAVPSICKDGQEEQEKPAESEEKVELEASKTEDATSVSKKQADSLSREVPQPEPRAPIVPVAAPNTKEAVSPPKTQKRRSSILKRLSSKNHRKLGKKQQEDKEEKKKKKRLSFFGKKKSAAAEAAVPQTSNPTPAPAPAIIVTPEQRKVVEALHGAAVTAVLTDEQVLGLLIKMQENPAAQEQSSSTEPVGVASSVANNIVDDQNAAESAPIKSGVSQDYELIEDQKAAASVVDDKGMALGVGADKESVDLDMVEEAPGMMVVSLPSQQSISANGSMMSQKSAKSQKSTKSHRSQKTASTQKTGTSSKNKKIGSVSPAPTSPKSASKSPASETKAPMSPVAYDEGFELNF